MARMRDGKEQQPGRERSEVGDILEVERAEEEHRDHERGGDADHEHPGGHGATGQQTEVYQRRGCGALAPRPPSCTPSCTPPPKRHPLDASLLRKSPN